MPDPTTPVHPPEDEFMAELGEEFSAQCRLQMKALRRALADNDWRTIAALAHEIKGTAPVFGYDQAGETARRLETAAKAARGDEVARLLDEISLLLPAGDPHS